jgi:peptidyl-tRNA hydrolase
MTIPVLYILVRNDLTSLSCGKAMAQASHASNAFVHHFHRYTQSYNLRSLHDNIEKDTIKGFNDWENSTRQGFGTVLTLEAKITDIYSTVSIFEKLGYVTGVVHDPTYPIVDGEVVHHIPLDTCAYVFVPSKETDFIASALLKRFSLHP